MTHGRRNGMRFDRKEWRIHHINLLANFHFIIHFQRMDNYKFTSLLAQTSLSVWEKYNLTVIFNTLTDNRKIEIIENWRVYYDKILSIHNIAEEEKTENIRITFAKINHLIDEALLRDEARKIEESKQEAEREEEKKSSEIYDTQRKMEQLRHIGRPPMG